MSAAQADHAASDDGHMTLHGRLLTVWGRQMSMPVPGPSGELQSRYVITLGYGVGCRLNVETTRQNVEILRMRLRDLEASWRAGGSVTGAARLLHVSQPAASKALQQVERQWGCPVWVTG